MYQAPTPPQPLAEKLVLRYPGGMGEPEQVQMPLRTSWWYQAPMPLQPVRA
ncbi:hypothetical protein [Streptomyces sp. I05A-00742]|uniref:hypothetical protein n=1 Tax=Streptomyces sp. I05A-00742 TaxID=2732853 RepID=UPI002017EEA5|nr:hypothetical protein [Streptomyces sp. I05A-00742]